MLLMSLFHLEYIVKSLSCGLEISAVSNSALWRTSPSLLSPRLTSSYPGPFCITHTWCSVSARCSDPPRLEIIRILFVFHLHTYRASWTILQLVNPYSFCQLQPNYYFLDEAFSELAALTSILPLPTPNLVRFIAPFCFLVSLFSTYTRMLLGLGKLFIV